MYQLTNLKIRRIILSLRKLGVIKYAKFKHCNHAIMDISNVEPAYKLRWIILWAAITAPAWLLLAAYVDEVYNEARFSKYVGMLIASVIISIMLSDFAFWGVFKFAPLQYIAGYAILYYSLRTIKQMYLFAK